MSSEAGVVYVAIGDKARREADISRAMLSRCYGGPVTVIEKSQREDLSPVQASRWAKLNLDKLSPYRDTLYLDADTRPNVNPQAGFDVLADGFDLVIVHSSNQGPDVLWHLGENERQACVSELGRVPLQLQAGVFWFRGGERMRRLFSAWRSEWERWREQDQGALLRALDKAPVKVWLFGRHWNGGPCIQHLFGNCRP